MTSKEPREETLTGRKIGKKVVCIECINELYEALGLKKEKQVDDLYIH